MRAREAYVLRSAVRPLTPIPRDEIFLQLTLATSDHRESGHCWKGFQGQRLKIKVIGRRNALLRQMLTFRQCGVEANLFHICYQCKMLVKYGQRSIKGEYVYMGDNTAGLSHHLKNLHSRRRLMIIQLRPTGRAHPRRLYHKRIRSYYSRSASHVRHGYARAGSVDVWWIRWKNEVRLDIHRWWSGPKVLRRNGRPTSDRKTW